MSAHPQLSEGNAAEMVKYILSFNGEKPAEKAVAKLPLAGSYTPEVPSSENGKGGYILRAAYRDRGTKGMAGIETERAVVLRNPTIPATVEQIDDYKDVSFTTAQTSKALMTSNGSYLALKNIDLAGIKTIDCLLWVEPTVAGGVLEVHLDTPDGKLIGETAPNVPGKAMKVNTVKITPAPVTGLHTLYFVAKNASAPAKQPLFQISRFQFTL